MSVAPHKRPVNIGGLESPEWMSEDCVRCPHCAEVHDLGDYPPCDWHSMWSEIHADSGETIEIECQSCDKPIRFRTFLTINVIVEDKQNLPAPEVKP